MSPLIRSSWAPSIKPPRFSMVIAAPMSRAKMVSTSTSSMRVKPGRVREARCLNVNFMGVGLRLNRGREEKSRAGADIRHGIKDGGNDRKSHGSHDHKEK